MWDQLSAEYHAWGLHMNFSKTEYMTNNPDDLFIDGEKIKKVDNFCYLESIIEIGGTSDLEIRRISNGRKATGMLATGYGAETSFTELK